MLDCAFIAPLSFNYANEKDEKASLKHARAGVVGWGRWRRDRRRVKCRFCLGVQFFRDSIRAFFVRKKIKENRTRAVKSLRLCSFGVIRIRISDPRSVWIMVHQRNRWPEWIHRFIWCTMIQTDLGSLIRIRISPKERSLISCTLCS